MEKIINEILNTALIGTDKKAADYSILDADILNPLEQISHNDPEEKLIRAAALLIYFHEAGSKLKKYKGPAIENIQESSEQCGPIFAHQLEKILILDINLKDFFLGLWLDKIIGKNQIAREDQILTLIDEGIKSNQFLRNKILQTIGEKGKIILSFKPAFSVGTPYKSGIQKWIEGSNAERLEFIAENRLIAFDLIKKDWNSESIVFKKSVIEIISKDSNADEILFIQELYDNEFVFKAKEKKTEREIRNLLALKLVTIPNHPLHQLLVDKIKSYCVEEKKGGFFGLGNTITRAFKLPEKPDEFFNKDHFNARLGVEPVNNDSALYINEVNYLFANLLPFISTAEWASLLNQKHSDVFDYFLKDKQFLTLIEGKKISYLQQALYESCFNFAERELILYLFDQSFMAHSQIQDLIPLLNSDDLLFWLKSQKNPFSSNYVMFWTQKNGIWDKSFSHTILSDSYEHIVKNNKYTSESISRQMAKFVHLDAETELEKLKNKLTQDTYSDHWLKIVYKPLKEAIGIRKIIDQY
ncbi:MAG TPA: hypothetical protein PLY70_06595 [Saprospiraceae bacterium]|nr:hypothetical protein [Saprospiraceae bacterium]HPN69347.1 hypothetical protein [Saprospiraceae bacterium]